MPVNNKYMQSADALLKRAKAWLAFSPPTHRSPLEIIADAIEFGRACPEEAARDIAALTVIDLEQNRLLVEGAKPPAAIK